MIKERIQLAEAMGLDPNDQIQTYSAGNVAAFDPFIDANDDYAVLDFFQGNRKFEELLNGWNVTSYEKGMFARAALEVINET